MFFLLSRFDNWSELRGAQFPSKFLRSFFINRDMLNNWKHNLFPLKRNQCCDPLRLSKFSMKLFTRRLRICNWVRGFIRWECTVRKTTSHCYASTCVSHGLIENWRTELIDWGEWNCINFCQNWIRVALSFDLNGSRREMSKRLFAGRMKTHVQRAFNQPRSRTSLFSGIRLRHTWI